MAQDDLASFAKRIQRRGRQVERGVSKVVQAAAITADRELVLNTPVDTGRARSNWIATLGVPTADIIEPYAPGQLLGRGEGPNAEGALAQARDAISRRKPGQSIYISNNVRYIGRLNDGSSAQAPAGFVQMAVKRAVEFIRSVRVFDDN